MPKVMLEGYKCERCGHTWIPRSKIEEAPTICPKCKSPYWDKPRRIGSRINEQRVKEQNVKGDVVKNE